MYAATFGIIGGGALWAKYDTQLLGYATIGSLSLYAIAGIYSLIVYGDSYDKPKKAKK